MIDDIMSRYMDGLLAEDEAFFLLQSHGLSDADACEVMDTWDPLD